VKEEATMKRWMILSVMLCLAGLVRAQTATTAPATPQAADVAAPKVDAKTGQPQKQFMDKHAKYVERAKQGDIDILFMGDSITEGWNGRGKDVWKERYADRKAANFGVGGDRTQHVLWRAADGELENIHPKVVVLMIGTNNIGRDISKADPADKIANGVKKIVDLVREKTGAKVLILAIFPRSDGKDQLDAIQQRQHEVNDIIKKLDDGKNVRYLDLWDKFIGPDGKNVPDEIMADHLHPGDKGYTIWADAMEPLLKEMLGG
jgi:lysophospholipase L1-like esterase